MHYTQPNIHHTSHEASIYCSLSCTLFNNIGNGATANAKQAAVTNGRAPEAIIEPPPTPPPLQLNSNNLLDKIGVTILAAALVEVNKAKFLDRASLFTEELATNAAVEVSATAAPARFIMYNIL